MPDAREPHPAPAPEAPVHPVDASLEGGAALHDVSQDDRSVQERDGPTEVRAADALVRKALAFLGELFPAAHAHVGYVRKDDAPLLGGTASSPHAGKSGRFEDIREVPGHAEFLRVVTIDVDERISRFLGEDDEAHLAATSARFKIPVILAHEWTRHLTGRALGEAHEALRAQLPAHIIAHLIADQFARVTDREAYRFARHGEPQSAHDRLTSTIVESLDYMETLTRSRVEHQELSHGLVVAPLPEDDDRQDPDADVPDHQALQGRYPEDFRGLKRTSLLTDGYQSALWITPAGDAAKIITRDTLGDVRSLLDRDFGSLSFLAAASKERTGVGLMLRPGGSVMTFANGQPLFIRRSGVWHGLIWNQIRSTLVGRYGDIGAQLFGIVLILTTSSKGGILAIVDDGAEDLNLNEKDRVDRARAAPPQQQGGPASAENGDPEAPEQPAAEQTPEWLLHRLLPAGNLLDLSRPTLALLAGIDGATIVDEKGRLLSYGAIVQSWQGRSEGARTAAARTLSAHGLVVKVSEDGPVQIFEGGDPVLTV